MAQPEFFSGKILYPFIGALLAISALFGLLIMPRLGQGSAFIDRPAPDFELPVVANGASGNARIRLTAMATTGAAIEARRVGVVDRCRAMPGEQHQPRKALRQRHGAQHRLGHVDPFAGAKAGGAAALRFGGDMRSQPCRDPRRQPVRAWMRDRARQPQRIAHQLEAEGLLQRGEDVRHDRFGSFTMRGWFLTHAGRLAYCMTCEDELPNVEGNRPTREAVSPATGTAAGSTAKSAQAMAW